MMGLVRLYVEPSESLPPQHVPDDYQPVIDIVPEHAQRVRQYVPDDSVIDIAANTPSAFARITARDLGAPLMTVTLDATLGGPASTATSTWRGLGDCAKHSRWWGVVSFG